MGAFDKFRSSGKIFWNSSGRQISRIPLRLGYTPRRINEMLELYYSEYSIDMFDENNIDKLFSFYPIKEFTHSDIYKILKTVQKGHNDYITDYLSYEKALKAYYNIHGKDTEWLVGIFAERYDLDRFNITAEDVLDDLHKIMKSEPIIPNSKQTNSENNAIAYKREKAELDYEKFINSSLEERVLQEINKIPKTFDYSSNTLENNKAIVGACVVVVSEIIDQVVNNNMVKELKVTLNAKRQRYRTVSEYNTCLENNIVFELYKYDNFIDIFDVLNDNSLRAEDMDIQTFYTLMLEDSQKKVVSAKQLSQTNQAVRNLLVNYSYKDTENREYDYIFSSLKVQAISYVIQSVLYGQLEVGNQRVVTIDFFRQFSAKDSKSAFDLVITNEIAKRLSNFY